MGCWGNQPTEPPFVFAHGSMLVIIIHETMCEKLNAVFVNRVNNVHRNLEVWLSWLSEKLGYATA